MCLGCRSQDQQGRLRPETRHRVAREPVDGAPDRIRTDVQSAAVCPAAARRLSADHPQHLREPEQLAAVRHARQRYSGIRRSGTERELLAAAEHRHDADPRSGKRLSRLHPVVERVDRAPAAVRHVDQRRLCRHEDHARLREHRAERVASRRWRAGSCLLRTSSSARHRRRYLAAGTERCITRCNCS